MPNTSLPFVFFCGISSILFLKINQDANIKFALAKTSYFMTGSKIISQMYFISKIIVCCSNTVLTHRSFRVRVHDAFFCPSVQVVVFPKHRSSGLFFRYYSSATCQIGCRARYCSSLITSKFSPLVPNATIRS